MPIIVGMDYGTKRCGFAVSDPSGTIALPVDTLTVNSKADIIAAAKSVCADREAERLVVGLPINMNGTIGPMAEKVNRFVEALTPELDIPIETIDERLSTSQVERVLLDADVSREKRKKVRDKMAAQVILQSYLDAQPGMIDFDYLV